MREAAIAALRNKECDVTVDGDGEVQSVYASNIEFSEKEVRHLKQFAKIKKLTLFSCVHDDSVWPILERLSELQELTLWGRLPNHPIGSDELIIFPLEEYPLVAQGVSDNGSQFLLCLKNLRSLDLRVSRIGDKTLGHVGQLESLERLSLLHTRISGAGLANLNGLRKLRELCLVQTATDDNGLSHISTLTNLAKLELEATRVSDLGMIHVGKLIGLEMLSVHNTDVSEQGLGHIQSLTRLRTLYVGSPITRIGAHFLKALTGLTDLYVGSSNKGRSMTKPEVKWLQAELPNVSVYA